MKVYELKRTQILHAPVHEVWAFFSTPVNLNVITPEWLDFKIVSELSETHEGQIIIYRIRLLPGWRQTWVTEIKNVVPQSSFIDEQRFGPYRFWHHLHTFEEVGEGMRMTDHVYYIVPFGPLGRLVHRLAIARALESIFDHRYRVLDEMFNRVSPAQPATML